MLGYQHHFMDIALLLARQGVGRCGSNPSVGCVIAHQNRIIARGRTGEGGIPHAETIALAHAKEKTQGAELYTSLEPCTHHGKTPPCVDAIIKAGIKKVIYAVEDPDPRVSGKGIVALQKEGIAVIPADRKRHRLYEPILGYLKRQNSGIPYFSLKMATSRDGKIALEKNKQFWITQEDSRRHGHLLRAQHDAVLTGIGTVLADDPLLTCRLVGLESATPIRIILDSNLRIPTESQLVQTAIDVPLWIITAQNIPHEKEESLRQKNVKIFNVKKNTSGISLKRMAELLGKEGINTVLVEAGSALTTSFLKEEMVDKIYHYTAPLWIGDEGLPCLGHLGKDIKEGMNTPSLQQSHFFSSDSLDIFGRA